MKPIHKPYTKTKTNIICGFTVRMYYKKDLAMISIYTKQTTSKQPVCLPKHIQEGPLYIGGVIENLLWITIGMYTEENLTKIFTRHTVQPKLPP